MPYPIAKVRLTADLTKYHPELKEGAEGTTRWQRATWGVFVDFPKAGRWDILEKSIQEIPE